MKHFETIVQWSVPDNDNRPNFADTMARIIATHLEQLSLVDRDLLVDSVRTIDPSFHF